MKNFTPLRSLLLCFLLISAGFSAFSQQIEKSITVSNGDRIGFLEYKPTDYGVDKNKKYPVILFLHGIGERGNGTTQLKNVSCCGLPRMIKLGHKMNFTWNGKTETFLVISPQCPEKYWMWPALVVDELLDYARTELQSDPDRIFITGLSMGGGGTYRYISEKQANAEKVAAAATICSPCTFSSGRNVANAKLPVWSFHAADDDVALPGCTEAAINKINYEKPEVKPLMTIWPSGGHIVWDRVYTDTSYRFNNVLNIYEWFLGQNKALAPNKPPVADAGADLYINKNQGTVTLNASASADADGKLVRYVWRKIAGPNAGSITTAMGTNSSTSVTGLNTAGVYKYELAVVDDRAAYTLDTVAVTVGDSPSPAPPPAPAPAPTPAPAPAPAPAPVPADPIVGNQAPVAKAGPDQTIPTEWKYAPLLNATTSLDFDGWIKSFSWSKLSGPDSYSFTNPSSGQTRVNDMVPGAYVFRVFVTDNNGAVSTDDITINMTINGSLPVATPAPAAPAGNKPPLANAGADQVIPVEWNYAPLLNATLSSDSDGWISAFAWTKVSGPDSYSFSNAAGGQTRALNLVAGSYTFRITVTDNKGVTSTDDVTIDMTVNGLLPGQTPIQAPEPENIAPIARAGVDQTIPIEWNYAPLLNATTSVDTDGWISAFSWSKVSGPSSCELSTPASGQTRAKNLTAGTYVFRVSVTDNKGAVSTDDVKVIVTSGSKATLDTTDNFSASTITEIKGREQAKISVYPNPAVSHVNLNFYSGQTGKHSAMIYDGTGRLVKTVGFEKNGNEVKRNVQVNDLPSGLYHVVVGNASGHVSNSRFIKR